MYKLTLWAATKVLCFCLLFTACGGLSDEDGDMTEEEALASCKAALATAPEVMEKVSYDDPDSVELSRNSGASGLLVKKNDAITWLIVKTTLQEGLPGTPYFGSFNNSQQFAVEVLQTDADSPDYWQIPITFPATDIAITYEVYYECADNSVSPSTIYTLDTPAICEIKNRYQVRYERYLGLAATKETTSVDVIYRFTPGGDFYFMSHIPYDQISSTAYVTSANYSYVFENFLDVFSAENSDEAYADELIFSVDLHELTGISEEELAVWDDGAVAIEVEVKLCGDAFGERLFMLQWQLP